MTCPPGCELRLRNGSTASELGRLPGEEPPSLPGTAGAPTRRRERGARARRRGAPASRATSGARSRSCQRPGRRFPELGQGLFELDSRVAHVAEPAVRILLQAAAEEVPDSQRRVGRQSIPVRVGREDGRENVGDGLPRERALAAQELVHDAAERPDVRSLVHGLAPRLFGAHELRGSEDDAGLRSLEDESGGERGVRVGAALPRVENLRESQVEDLHPALRRDLDVGGLQVAVNDAALVRGLQRLRDLPADSQRVDERHGAVRDPLRERFARHQLHHDELGAVRFLEPVDRGDAGMVESREHARLPLEPRQSRRVARELLGQSLDRDLASQTGIVGPVDLSHAAGPQQVQNRVDAELRARREGHRVPRFYAPTDPLNPQTLAPTMFRVARVAEPADARDLGSRGETREGSSPSSRTRTVALARSGADFVTGARLAKDRLDRAPAPSSRTRSRLAHQKSAG